MATSNTFSIIFNSLLNKPWKRFVILVVAGGAGALLVIFCREWIFCFLGVTGRAKDYLILPMLSFFVFIALWAFRTYDTRQQIQQANFVKGLDNLVSDNPLQVDIGVILLLEVSKATPAFDTEIRLAFIKRLKEPVKKHERMKFQEGVSNRFSYAQYIIQWLIDHPRVSGKKPDLVGMNCECQEFTSGKSHGGTNTKLEMVKILPETSGGSPKEPNISSGDNSPHLPTYYFLRADCQNISFKNVDLSGFDFRGAKNVNMVGGYIVNRSRPPLGVISTTLSEYIDSKTGEVVKNPPVEIDGS